MQSSVIVILIFCIAFAALTYYLGFRLPYFATQYLSQSASVCLTFMIIPFLMYTLWSQAGEKDRLQETGIVPHPAIHSALGLTTSLKKTPTWTFSVDPTLETVSEFYLDENNRPGWEILNNDSVLFVLQSDNETMSISLYKQRSEASIIYILSNK